MSLQMATPEERKTMGTCIEELKKGIDELSEAHKRQNIPQIGAALCDVEYHIQELLKLLEREQPFFNADDFRKFVRKAHQKN